MLNARERLVKRLFDIFMAVIAIFLTWWIILIAWIVASIETKSNGLFRQVRIGEKAKPFIVFKIKTMKNILGKESTVTVSGNARITKSGAFFRRTKIDELPQLFNILLGQMSFVGPRPDVAGFADILEGEDRIILDIRPGITGPASLKYKEEENLLAEQENPEKYNKEILWPDKVAINKTYIKSWSLKKDMKYLIQTLIG